MQHQLGLNAQNLPLEDDSPLGHLRRLYEQAKDIGMRDMISWRGERFGERYLLTWSALLCDKRLEEYDSNAECDHIDFFTSCPRLRQFFRREIESRDVSILRKFRHILEFSTRPELIKAAFPHIRDDYCVDRAKQNHLHIEDSILTIKIFCGGFLRDREMKINEESFQVVSKVFDFASTRDPLSLSCEEFNRLLQVRIALANQG